MGKVTIEEVARLAGVSVASVSRFLNKPELITEKKRKSIAKAVKELNYKPSVYARRLAGVKLNTYGLIIPGYEGIFYSFYALEIIRSITLALERKDIDLHVHIFWGKDHFRSSLVDGVIFADIIGNESQLKRILGEGLECVVINRKIDDLKVNYVAVDNYKGAYEATEFLISHGHKNIAHLAGDLAVQCSQERILGYKQALEDNKIKVLEEYVKITNFSRFRAREKLEELFSDKKNRPTAVFCASDELALEVISFALEKNIRVPEDLSVIGFDDNPQCVYSSVALTTVKQPFVEMADKAVEILKKTAREKVERIVLSPTLVVRESVGFA